MTAITAQGRQMAALLIASQEGFRSKPYWDANGKVWTVGYGFTTLNGHPVTSKTPAMTQAQAEAELETQLNTYVTAVEKAVTVSLTDGQAAALIDFAYNLGPHALQVSVLLRLLNAGNYDGAAGQFAAWAYAGGKKLPDLVNRRALEAQVFRNNKLPASIEEATDDGNNKPGATASGSADPQQRGVSQPAVLGSARA